MGQITAQMVKDLRDRTGVGMAKCKQALEEAHGDMELAIDNLRKQGMASAVKKEGRETNEGLIANAEDDKTIVLVEVNAETDFVVKNERFQLFAKQVAENGLKHGSDNLESFLKKQCLHDTNLTLDELRASIIQNLGENIQIRKLKCIPKKEAASYGLYSHSGGKLVTLVEINGTKGEEALARDIAMHIAAEAPEYLTPNEIPEQIISREKEIAKAQVQNKPSHITDKIVEGKLNAFFDQVCLLRQKFVKNPDLTIQVLVEKRGKEIGKSLQVTSFIRWKVGE